MKSKIINNKTVVLSSIVIMYFLMTKELLPTVVYFLVAIPFAIFFFPVQLFLDKELKKINIVSYFTISTSIAFSCISQYIDADSVSFQLSLLFLLVLNFALLLLDTNAGQLKNKNLHVILLVLIPLLFFVK